jgi:large subunit ribosomal protein L23
MIIKYPVSNEKAIRLMESENKLVFAVERTATKTEIKEAIVQLYGAKVVSINTKIGPNGLKYAYVRFDVSSPAIDIATNMGLI